MKFEIEIKVHDETRGLILAVSMGKTLLGLEDLDRAREELDLPELSADLLNRKVESVTKVAVYCEIDEATARKSGHFVQRCERTVNCPHKGLNKFFSKQIKTTVVPETGEITKAWFVYEVDKEAVIKAWKDAGYPLKWKVEEEG